MGSKRKERFSSIWSLSARFLLSFGNLKSLIKQFHTSTDSTTTKCPWTLFLFTFFFLSGSVIKASVLYLKRFRGSGFSFQVEVGFSTV